jgi:pimeloyl-ACP methyl ester carboxylesterase
MLPMARRIIAKRLTASYVPDPPLADRIAAAADVWSRPSQAEAMVWDSRNLDVAIRSCNVRYNEITSAAIILVGDHDNPDRESVPLAKLISNAELRVVPRTGHLIPHVRPEAIIAAIDALSERSWRH